MLTEEIRQAIVDTIKETQPEAFVVHIDLRKGRQSVLNIKVDTDRGISLAECSEISRRVGAALEDRADMAFSYLLEVSSPGVGFPLKLHRQYVKEVGRHLQVALHNGEVLKGQLKAVNGQHIELELILKKQSKRKRKAAQAAGQPLPDPTRTVSFEDIKEAKVIII